MRLACFVPDYVLNKKYKSCIMNSHIDSKIPEANCE